MTGKKLVWLNPAFVTVIALLSVSLLRAQHSGPQLGSRDTIEPPLDGAFLGAWGDTSFGAPQASIASLETLLGHKLAVHLSYWQFNSGKQLPAIATDPAILDDIAKGRYPLISWGCSHDIYTTFQQIADGIYDDSIVIPAANAVRSLRSKVFIRLSWEFNNHVGDPSSDPKGNSCFSPANVGNVPAEEAEYIAYFRHIVDFFRVHGVRNVTWVWCPEVSAESMQKFPVPDFYPGDDYVDWIAGDTYDKAMPSQGFVGIWTPFWSAFSSYGKPLMIAETGEINNATDDFTQQKFFSDAEAALLPGGDFNRSPWERIAAFTYFDTEDSTGLWDWSVQVPPDRGGERAWATMASNRFFQTAPGDRCF